MLSTFCHIVYALDSLLYIISALVISYTPSSFSSVPALSNLSTLSLLSTLGVVEPGRPLEPTENVDQDRTSGAQDPRRPPQSAAHFRQKIVHYIRENP